MHPIQLVVHLFQVKLFRIGFASQPGQVRLVFFAGRIPDCLQKLGITANAADIFGWAGVRSGQAKAESSNKLVFLIGS